MTRTPDVGRVRQALRDATMESHQRVDEIFSHYLFESRERYGAFLTAHGRALGALEPLAGPAEPRLPLLLDDLAILGQPTPTPLAIAPQPGESFRWGVRYALEGSRLGGAMLARRVPDGLPRSYLAAVHAKGRWAAFQTMLDEAAAQGGEAWIDGAVQGARTAFSLFATAGAEGQASIDG